MDKVDKQRGKVMRYWDFVRDSLTEKTHWYLTPDSVRVEPDIECVEKCWEIIRSEATNYEEMVAYLTAQGQTMVDLTTIIKHIMDVVDANLNNRGVKVKDNDVMIFNLEQFVEKATELDYSMCVEMLVRRLVGIKGEPDYRKIIREIIENETDVSSNANIQTLELAEAEDEETEEVGEQ